MERLTFTVREVKDLLGIGRSKVYELLKKGTIPSFRLDGRIIISKKKLDEFIDGKTQDGACHGCRQL